MAKFDIFYPVVLLRIPLSSPRNGLEFSLNRHHAQVNAAKCLADQLAPRLQCIMSVYGSW